MGVDIFWIGLNRAELSCWRLTLIMPVKTFQVRSDNPSNKHLHQLMLMLHLFEWLCNMQLIHACQEENCFE